MKKLTLIFVVLVTLISCVKPTSSRNYKYTLKRENGLYIEVFKAGILGRMTARYLTDSTKFRVLIGTSNDETEQIHCRIKGDRIEVERRKRVKGEGRQQDVQIVVSTTVYHLQELEKNRSFEE
jgi:hypothetical protein